VFLDQNQHRKMCLLSNSSVLTPLTQAVLSLPKSHILPKVRFRSVVTVSPLAPAITCPALDSSQEVTNAPPDRVLHRVDLPEVGVSVELFRLDDLCHLRLASSTGYAGIFNSLAWQ
jgi:hypothetical protein